MRQPRILHRHLAVENTPPTGFAGQPAPRSDKSRNHDVSADIESAFTWVQTQRPTLSEITTWQPIVGYPARCPLYIGNYRPNMFIIRIHIDKLKHVQRLTK
jgi:hypothetical protein